MEFYKKICQIAKNQGYKSVNDFCLNGLGYKSSEKINRLKDSNNKPSIDIVIDITNKFESISMDWLLTGKGGMLRTTNEHLPNVNVITKPDLRTPHRPTSELVQFYDVDFAAGSVTFFDDVNSQTPSYTMDIPDFNGCIAFRAYGDSMYPTVYSGSIVFAKRNDQWADGLEYGQMYGIVLHDGTRYLKYIRKSKTEKRFLLKSENKKYDDFEIDKSRIKSIWTINGWLNKNA